MKKLHLPTLGLAVLLTLVILAGYHLTMGRD